MRADKSIALLDLLKARFFHIILIFYTSLLTYWMIWGFGRRQMDEFRYNLKPFYTISRYIKYCLNDPHIWVINLVGNVCVFIPFGFLVPAVFGGKIKKTILISFCGLVILECAQLISRKGMFDIDDFILNLLGVLIGYTIYSLIKK